MKDSQSLKKKVRKFIKKEGKKSDPQKPRVSLREKAGKLAERIKKKEIRSKEKKETPSVLRAWLTSFQFVRLKNRKQEDFHPKTDPPAGERKPTTGFSFKKFDTDLKLLLLPSILCIILAILNLLNSNVVTELFSNTLNPLASSGKINPYPFVRSGNVPDITAKAAIIIDANSQVILFSKNQNLRFSMASTTKIMTALTALNYFKPRNVLTVKSANNEGSVVGLLIGEKFYFNELLYALLLPSANDAAVTIADNYPGGADAFVNQMNENAHTLHLVDTHFSDPTGLDDDNDYTTVIDMARLASRAVTNPVFANIIATKNTVITDINYGKEYRVSNLNKLLGIDGVNGIKTGTTAGAGEVLVTSTVQNGHTYIIVVMNSQDRFEDTKRLLAYIAENVHYVFPSPL